MSTLVTCTAQTTCDVDVADDHAPDVRIASSLQEADCGLQAYHLLLAGLLGFLFGGVVCVGLYMYRQHHRQQQLRHSAATTCDNKYSTLQRLKQKESDLQQNHYVNPSDLDIHIPSTHTAPYKYYNSLNTRSLNRKDNHNKMTVMKYEITKKIKKIKYQPCRPCNACVRSIR